MHKILLSVLFTLFFIRAEAKNDYLPFVKHRKKSARIEESTKPHLNIRKEGTQFVVDYHFDGAFMSRHEALGDMYRLLHIDGLNMSTKVGAPSLPIKSDYFLASKGESISIEMGNLTYCDYEGVDIYPALEQARDTEGAPEPEFEKDREIYEKDAFFPKNIVSISTDQQMRSARILKVNVSPVQYNPKRKILRVYSNLTYKFHRQNDAISLNESDAVASQLKGMAINGEDVIPIANIPNMANGNNKDYILVTTERFRAQAERFASWKACMGHSVEVVSKDTWTVEEVEEAVHSRYHSWNEKPKYLLIIGDYEDVPARKFEATDGDDFYSDLSYVCMDGAADFTPDMAKGRLSVSSVNEAKVVVDKIINYEKYPIEDENFYQNGLNCAQFQDDERDGYATRRFCHTSEDVRDYMINQGYDVQRIYYASRGVNPTHFNNGMFSNGEAIAPELLKANGFQWNGSHQNIKAAIDEGKFYLLHRDHGYAGGTGWAHPEFLTNQIDDLKNGDKLPVVFSINCHTGEFQLKECFAEKFLRKENGGAVAVIAASYYSLSGNNDGLALGMFESIWPNPGFNPSFGHGAGVVGPHPHHFDHATTSLGDVLNLGLLRMDETWAPGNTSRIYTYRLFHLFGDPSMKIWKAKPTKVTATFPENLSCGDQEITVKDISQVGGIITVVQGENILAKKKITQATETLHFDGVDDMSDVMVTISGDQLYPISKSYTITGCHSIPKAKFDVLGSKMSIDNKEGVISFKDRSSYRPNTWLWDFGTDKIEFLEGTTATSQNPKVKYLEKGLYTVSLEVTNDYGSHKITKKDAVALFKEVGAIDCTGATQSLQWFDNLGILSVKIGKQKITSQDASSDKGYQDFTSKTPFYVSPGTNSDMEILITGEEQDGKVYCDFNGDNHFTADEMCYEFEGKQKKVAFLLSIPKDIEICTKLRLRVIVDKASNTIDDACYAPEKGQVEDYALVAMSGIASVLTQEASAIGMNTITIGGRDLGAAMDQVLEKGVVIGKNEDPTLQDIRLASNQKNIDDYQIIVSDLESNTSYHYRAYVINEKGLSYGNEKVVRTYGVLPELRTITVEKNVAYSHRIDLNIIPEESSDQVWGYLLVWSQGDDPIATPQNGKILSNHVIYLQSKEKRFEHLGLNANTQYNYKVYRYVNEGEHIAYEKRGSNSISITTLKEGDYPTAQIKSPVKALSGVMLADLDNRAERAVGGFHNFKAMTANLSPGFPYVLQVEYDCPKDVEDGTIGVWIDLNHDGYLDQSNEIYGSKKANETNGVLSFEMNVSTPVFGPTLLRIAYYDSKSNFSFDQNIGKAHLEDYTINIDPTVKIVGLWKGTYSNQWNEVDNWDDHKVPSSSIDVKIRDGAPNYPVISTKANARSIELSKSGSLNIAEGANLEVDQSIQLDGSLTLASKGKLQVGRNVSLNGTLRLENKAQMVVVKDLSTKGNIFIYGGSLTVGNTLYSDHGSLFLLNEGSFNVDVMAHEIGSDWVKGQYELIKGDFTFRKALFSTSMANSFTKKEVNFIVKEEFGLSEKSWSKGFNGSVKFVESGREHKLVCSKQGSYVHMNSLTVDIGSDVLTLCSRVNNKEIKVDGDVKILSGVVRTYSGMTTLDKLECQSLELTKNATLDLSDANIRIHKDIVGDGNFLSDQARFKFVGDETQHIQSSLNMYSLDHSGTHMLRIEATVKVLDQITARNADIALGENLTFTLGKNGTSNWNDYALEVADDATFRKEIGVEDYTYFDFVLKKSDVKTKYEYWINDGSKQNGWIDFRLQEISKSSIIADHTIPYVIQMNASDSLKKKKVGIQLTLSGFDRQGLAYYLGYKNEGIWDELRLLKDHGFYKEYDSPVIEMTAMTKADAPKVSMTLIDKHHGFIDGDISKAYLYRRDRYSQWAPLEDFHKIDLTGYKDKFFVCFAPSASSISSLGTVDLMKTAKIATSVRIMDGGTTSVYPNPFVSTITVVVHDKQSHTYELVDLCGRVVKYLKVDVKQSFSLESIPPGIYLLRDTQYGSIVKLIKKG
ncbi:T9SS type A sorting domain-containing protein [Halosquirtibacter laminarini]|uniref:T9SS type A sorting domain-containing protein n=1 Tax=Halosquirtibacter laminarini TaxID=3374600 RepID=A0AC61NIR2_9BACT|nr:T9SS type A sorting domain-containing protein [Prolixibacteraceae bacterium]